MAIAERLELRKALLRAMALTPTEDLLPSAISDAWGIVSKRLMSIQASHGAGLPLREAFTSKIPYGLASTVPPKPIVDVPFNEAIAIIKCLCEDSQEAYMALMIEANESPSNLLVRPLLEMMNMFYLGWLLVANQIRASSGLSIQENRNL